jgi:hypothetical protein
VTVTRSALVPVFVAVIVTLGTTAPLASLTSPVICPAVCACTANPDARHSPNTKSNLRMECSPYPASFHVSQDRSFRMAHC